MQKAWVFKDCRLIKPGLKSFVYLSLMLKHVIRPKKNRLGFTTQISDGTLGAKAINSKKKNQIFSKMKKGCILNPCLRLSFASTS